MLAQLTKGKDQNVMIIKASSYKIILMAHRKRYFQMEHSIEKEEFSSNIYSYWTY